MEKAHKIVVFLIISCSIIFIAACSSESATDPLDQMVQFTSHGEVDEIGMRLLQDSLLSNYQQVLDDLNVNDLPVVFVDVYESEEEYFDIMEECWGEKQYQYLLHVCSPDKIRVYDFGGASVWIVYKFTELVLMHMNPTIKNNPRWLYEAVCNYEAPFYVNPNELTYMVNGDYPDFDQLNDDQTIDKNKIAQVGYILVKYILEEFGQQALINLIMTNGDIQNTLSQSDEEFLNDWYDWIETKYFFN